MALRLPTDAVTGGSADVDVAADYLELTAFFSSDSAARTSDLANAASLAGEEDHADLDGEMLNGEEEIVSSAVYRIETRQRVLESTYPFSLDDSGDVLTCHLDEESVAQAAYVLSLVLSNLRSVSPVLDGSDFHPGDADVRELRRYFQYIATVALAAEVQGSAWSFGFPRPDGSPFLNKLEEIWRSLGDGLVKAQPGAPGQPKDDGIDVFAAREHRDRLPGFLLAVAQVATGKDARRKSLKGHLATFKGRWFEPQPVTNFIAYMIVPFATGRDQFVDDVRVMGNVLHRLRVPRRVAEAGSLVESGVAIEAYDLLPEVIGWVNNYRRHPGAAA